MRRPVASSFVFCVAKGSMSDIISQRVLEDHAISWRRNLSFSLYSGFYLGLAQYGIYNTLFIRIFGTSQSLRNSIRKVLADSLVHVPFVYFPVYYIRNTLSLGRVIAIDGIASYIQDATSSNLLISYYTLWPAVQMVTFTTISPHLRIPFIASVSFAWLMYLSFETRFFLSGEERPSDGPP